MIMIMIYSNLKGFTHWLNCR